MAAVNGRLKAVSPAEQLSVSARHVASDIFELAELQLELLRSDLRTASASAIPAILMLCACATALLGAVPVMLAGIALAISDAVGWPVWVCLLAVGGSMMLLVGIMLVVCGWKLRRSVDAFRNSQVELQQNIAWLRRIVQSEDANG